MRQALPHARRAAATLAAALGLAACGGAGGLSPAFPEARRAELEAITAELEAAAPREEGAVVVGVSPAPVRLWAWDARTGSVRWAVEAAPEVAPRVAGDVVVSQEAGSLVVRRLADGGVAARVETDGLTLRGADGEGGLSVLTLSTGGGVGARSRVVLLRNGAVAWSLAVDQAVGEPALHGGIVALPWAQQNLSLLDAATGRERARIHFGRGVVGHARAVGGRILFGQRGLAALDASLALDAALARDAGGPADGASAAETSWLMPGTDALPGSPALFRDGYQPPPSASSAAHHVQLAWAGAREGRGPRLDGDTMYLVFYRALFALEPSGARARWVATLPADVVGAAVTADTVVVLDEAGALHALSREDGRTVGHADVGLGATWASLDGVTLPALAPTETTSLGDQLLAATQDTDARLVPARAFAARLLAASPAPDVTARVLALCEDRALPPALRAAGCEALSQRRNGLEHALTALGRHAGHLTGTTAPPVGPLAQAVAAAGLRAAVPALIAHLRDPATPTADLVPLAAALGALGEPAAVEPLEAFVRLHHAESPEGPLADALTACMAALVLLEGPSAHTLLTEIAGSPMTMPAVRAAAAQLLTPPPAARAEGEAAAPSDDGAR